MHTVFTEIEALSGRAFTLDAAANDGGDNALCTDYCSPSKSFFDTVHTGHIWISVPFCKLLSFVQHYMHCKLLSPSSTSACILVPGYMLSPLQHLLSGMRLLKKYRKGTTLFDSPIETGPRAAMPGVHWPVYVFTDVPADTVEILDTDPLHQLHNERCNNYGHLTSNCPFN